MPEPLLGRGETRSNRPIVSNNAQTPSVSQTMARMPAAIHISPDGGKTVRRAPLAPSDSFSYESKRWGSAPVRPRPGYIQGLKLRYALEDLREVRSGLLVDVGCGGGNMAKAIKRERQELAVEGVDVSKSAIEWARREPEGVAFQLAEPERLPFGDARAAAVTMFDVLEHVDDPSRALGDIARVVKPGGLFCLAVPLEDQPWTIYRLVKAGRWWRSKLRHGGHIHAFSDRDVRELLDEAGFDVVRVRWSYQHLFALFDVLYFTFLDLRGPVSSSVEDFVVARSGWLSAPIRLAWASVTAAGWYEARAFRWMKGGCGHFTCRRREA
jgi:ubiquinone/menaquinone biosynthesis C-methylase UbiE